MIYSYIGGSDMYTKKCKECNKELSIDNFNKSKYIKSGYEGKCKECRKNQRRKHHEYKCEHCGKVFNPIGKRIFCSDDCSWKSKRLSLDVFIEDLKAHDKNLKYLGGYSGYINKVNIQCLKCEFVFNPTPNNLFFKKSGCPKCAGNIKKTTKQFKRDVEVLGRGEYLLLNEYRSNKYKTLIKHEKCGNKFNMTPEHWYRGQRCPKCRISKGEERIKNHLDKLDIKYKREYKFKECRNYYPLPFDFAIFKDDKLEFLIEYDGEQHFHPIDIWGGEESYKKVVKNDNIKNNFCKENDIYLLRISYHDFNNIEKILEKYIQ